jgi:hypothetical protein
MINMKRLIYVTMILIASALFFCSYVVAADRGVSPSNPGEAKYAQESAFAEKTAKEDVGADVIADTEEGAEPAKAKIKK